MLAQLRMPAIPAWQMVCPQTDSHDHLELRQMIVDDQAKRAGNTTVPPDSVRRNRVLALYHAIPFGRRQISPLLH
jgi:hypothetical protein